MNAKPEFSEPTAGGYSARMDAPGESGAAEPRLIDIRDIRAYERQPRRVSHPAHEDIKNSIRRHGLWQPLVVMPGTTNLTKEADLITAVLLYVSRCRAEGDRDALREMQVGFEEGESLRGLNVEDLHRAGSQGAHFLDIRLHRKRFWGAMASLVAMREEDDLKSRLIRAGAPMEMMRSLFRMSNREFTGRRRALAVNHGVGRPAELDEASENRLWAALSGSLRPDPNRPLDPERYLEIQAECGVPIRAIWNAVRRWIERGEGKAGC